MANSEIKAEQRLALSEQLPNESSPRRSTTASAHLGTCCCGRSLALKLRFTVVVLVDFASWMSRSSASATRPSCRSVTGIFSLTNDAWGAPVRRLC